MTVSARIVVVGAGPAGIRAAQTLVAAGHHPVVLDENPRCGGQIYRQPPAQAGFARSKRALYGFEAGKAHALHSTMASLLTDIDYRPDTLVWACDMQASRPDAERPIGTLATLQGGREKSVPFTHLVLAPGATDRILPIPGWTLPGVYTLGGAQTALKAQGCAIGSRVVLAGTGPLLYLVAYQYAKAGARIATVLDTSSLAMQTRALPKLARVPSALAKGLYYVGWLQAHGVRIERGVSLIDVRGERCVTGIAWRRGGESTDAYTGLEVTECNAIGLGFGLRPETQLADLAGCRFRFDATHGSWLPERDAAGRTSVAGIYVAGDGAGIAGADAAECAGRRAALAVIEDLSAKAMPSAHTRQAFALERTLRRISIFREGLEAAFAAPAGAANAWPDAMTVCRCEEVDAGALRDCIRSGAATEINRLKALTRVGMGRCQGRMCADAALALCAAETGRSLESLGRLRAQAPVKPIPLAHSLDDDAVCAVPEDARDE
ncbi:NAD(P)/FAD-dependent oxidoreductase [Trinickia sp. LjRoot230]|uniref:FAD/NAD(P)-dependent oxidoreductase n=1 Tax=Trinickia sp. LjRoot230 TaxID=3342288 RepID=UPI003ECFD23F